MLSALEQAGLQHRRAGRDLAQVDLTGVRAVVICATDGRRPRDVDLTQVSYFARTGLHVIYPSIVGCDLMPSSYYEAKVECEQLLANSLHSIIRATQYHQLLWGWYTARRRRPWLVVPSRTRYQVLDPAVHARALVQAAAGEPLGRGPDVGGPVAYEAVDLARSCQRAAGLKRLVVPINRRGLFGAALRAGANLTPNRDQSGETWNQFIGRQIGR
ncbi:MAG: hypothetical protein ABR609_08630 [Acidimicrobiia bacterium]